MKTFFSLAALAGVVLALPQAVTEEIAPDGGPPDSCSTSWQGQFEVAVVKMDGTSAKRDLSNLQKRAACGGEDTLVMTLSDGILVDAMSRVGYIASNYQFQFDGPPQAGSIYTAGFSVCNNGSLALGGSTVWWQCLSGSFYNLYDRYWAEQCEPIHLGIIPCGDNAAEVVGGADVAGTTMMATTVVTVISGTEVSTVETEVPIPMCQIFDGQIQAHLTPCAEIDIPPITVQPPAAPTTEAPAPPAPTTEEPAPPPAPTSFIPPSNGTTTSGALPITPTPTVPAPTTTPSAPPQGAGAVVSPNSLLALALGVLGAVMYL